jgi:hypothetical protein
MNRRLTVLLVVAAVSAALLLIDGGADGDVVEAVERSTPAAAVASAPAARPVPAASRPGAAEPAIARLIPRDELIGEEGETTQGADLMFGAQSWNPPPPAPTAAPAEAPPPPPPSAPPLPFTYIGKALEAGVWEVYLARADKTYIVKKQSVIDGVYRVDAIAPPTLTLTYLPLNQAQTLNIGVLE